MKFPMSNLQPLEATLKMWNRDLFKKIKKINYENSLKTSQVFPLRKKF